MKINLERIKNAIFGRCNTTAKFVHEESRLENGELHVKRVIKTGADAEKEIQTFSKKIFDKISIEFERADEW